MSVTERIYEAVLHAVRPVLRVAAPLHPKLRRGVAGRRGAPARLEAWARTERDFRRPLAWLHAPSVGEALMARAILAELEERRPELQSVFTHFSPSAERVAPRVGADAHDYLPWDVGRDVRPVLAALRPAVVIFVRTEIWPVLTREARAAGARLALVNAVLGEESSRLSAPASRFLGLAYGRLDAVGAVRDDDARRFGRLSVPAERVRVTGDARFDQVWRRVAGAVAAAGGPAGPARRPGAALADRLRDPDAFTVVAGSTWPPDERRLVPAFARLVERRGAARLVVAPHEPTERHLVGLEARLDDAGIGHARLGAVEEGRGVPPAAVVVDRVGVLAELYAAGDAAYVGGGFGRDGLHSVIEPAALGVPVLFGPRHGDAREAGELVGADGGRVVEDVDDAAARLLALADDPAACTEAGDAARAFVRSRLGGAARNAELVAGLLDAGEAAPVS